MDVKGSVALVTGGASGLGEACVRRLVGAGGSAIIVDLNEERGNALAQELGASVRFVKANVASEDDAKQAFAVAQEAFGKLDILINCAGIGAAARVVGKEGPMALAHFARTIEVNLIGSFNMIRLAGTIMSKQQPSGSGERGVIISTASVAAFDGQIGQAAYSASKGGVVGMTLPIAREFARFGIRVMTIAPGLFDTPLLAGLPEPARISLGAQVPFPPRLGNPAEYAALAHHIIENEMLNGEVIRLDGAIRMAPQ